MIKTIDIAYRGLKLVILIVCIGLGVAAAVNELARGEGNLFLARISRSSPQDLDEDPTARIDKQVSKDLDVLLETQIKVLARIDELIESLAEVKTRATLRRRRGTRRSVNQ